jgi:hypothetical protein
MNDRAVEIQHDGKSWKLLLLNKGKLEFTLDQFENWNDTAAAIQNWILRSIV